MLDITKNQTQLRKPKFKAVMIAHFSFTKTEILDMLKHSEIIVVEKVYEMPEKQLLAILVGGVYGLAELELTEKDYSKG